MRRPPPIGSLLPYAFVFAMRGVVALGGMLFSVLVARLAGPSSLGQIAVFIGLLGALANLARRGQDMLVARAVARAEQIPNGADPVSLLTFSLLRIIGSSIIVAILGAGLLASGILGERAPGTGLIFLIALPLMSVVTLVSGYMKGAGRAGISNLFQSGGVLLLASPIFLGLLRALSFDAAMLWSIVIAMVFLCAAALVMVARDAARGAGRPTPLAVDQRTELTVGELDFAIIASSAFLVQAGTFVLAAPFLSAHALGLARAAERLAQLIGFPMLAICPIIAPMIARLAHQGEATGLRRLTFKATAAGLILALPPAAFFLIFPRTALNLMGDGFGAASGYLVVMTVASLVLAASSPFAVVLNMGGGERRTMWINLLALVVAIALLAGLSHFYGGWGFVWAYAILALVRSLPIIALAMKHMSAADGVRSQEARA